MRSILLLVNPLFEQRAERRRDLLRVLAAFRHAGVSVETRETLPNHATGELVRSALGPKTDAVIVCGGDGTIFDAIQALAGTAVPVGVVPFGTGNILAQNLRIPRDPAAAVKALLTARRRVVPLAKLLCAEAGGEERSWFFTIAAGVGLHAALMASSKAWTKRVGGPAAYYAAGADLLLRHHVAPFQVEMTTAEGCRIEQVCCEAIAVRVAELNRWRPRGELDRPWLRLASVEGSSRGVLARAAWQAVLRSGTETQSASPTGGAAAYRNIVRAVFRPIEGYRYLSPLVVQADGEVLGVSSATVEMAEECVTLLSQA